MPCAMSSLRGASGVVGCDRVVCPLVLHTTTIAHLDVLLCTLLCFLLCAVLLCGAVPPVLWCALCLACPACGASAWCCGCGVRVRPAPCSPCPCGCVLRCASVPLCFSCLFSGHNTCPIYGGVICGPYTLPIYVPYFFRRAICDPFCTHSKSRPLDSECGFPKVGLNFLCSFFL